MIKNYVEFETLKGEIISKIDVDKKENTITFHTYNGTFKMFHEQDCCEDVYIESIVGDLNDLINNPITMAEEIIDELDAEDGHITYTFYKLATIKGYVDIRWNGESNGYYSESVDLIHISK